MSQAKLVHLRRFASEIFVSALRAVDAREATRRAIDVDGSKIRIVETGIDANKPIYVVSIGKAAGSMANALSEMINDRITEGVVTCQQQLPANLPKKWQRFDGGHPLPNEESLAAAQAAFAVLDKANAERAAVIFAVSGGGSAMIEWPINTGISLGDLQEANRLLVSCGATIAEINTVRRAFSAVKGGKLIQRAPHAQLVTLIISDTNPGDEANVASGPTLQATTTNLSASEIVYRYGLEANLPETILLAVRKSTAPEDTSQVNASHYVLADNVTARTAAATRAKSLGFAPVIAEEISEQSIAEGCAQLLRRLAAESPPICLISGGEFSCPVRGNGQGGRNLETVLRCAIEIDGGHDNLHLVLLSAGTDGIDGNSPAAGAIADETTVSRARALGLDASEFLAKSDSYMFFEKLGDALVTGPTGTNVRDIRILLKGDWWGADQ